MCVLSSLGHYGPVILYMPNHSYMVMVMVKKPTLFEYVNGTIREHPC